MKPLKFIFLFFFLCFLTINYAQSNIQVESLSPNVKLLDKNVYDLGEINPDQERELHFNVENTGSESIRILNVAGTCACYIIEEKRESLAPEESTIITIKYHPKQKRGSQLERIALLFDTAPHQYMFYLKSELKNAEIPKALTLTDTKAIKINQAAFNIEVFPNPASEMINVSIELLETERVSIDMVNTLGQKVFSNQVDQSGNILINVKDFSSGLYYLFFTKANGEIFKESVVIAHQ